LVGCGEVPLVIAVSFAIVGRVVRGRADADRGCSLASVVEVRFYPAEAARIIVGLAKKE